MIEPCGSIVRFQIKRLTEHIIILILSYLDSTALSITSVIVFLSLVLIDSMATDWSGENFLLPYLAKTHLRYFRKQ